MRDLERYIVLQVVDIRWREHLENMDYMREGIHLRGMAQKDPLVEYRNEGHIMFLELNRLDPRGGDRAALPRAGRGRRPADEERQRPRCRRPDGNGGGRTGTSATSTSRSPARTRSRPRARRGAAAAATAGDGGGAPRTADRSSSPSRRTSAATTRAGAARARSSSAATARDARPSGSSAPRSASTRSRRTTPATSTRLARDEERAPVHARPVGRRGPGFGDEWAARYVPAAGQDGTPGGLRDPQPRRRVPRPRGVRSSSTATPARARSATWSRPDARGRGVATAGRRPADALGLRRARARADHAADRRRATRRPSGSPSAAATRARGRCGPRT